MLLIRSWSTERRVVLDRQQVLAGAGLALRDLLELRRRLGAGRPRLGDAAVEELLADQRLRPDDAGGVLAEVLEARVGDVHHDDRLARTGRVVRVAGNGLALERDVDRIDAADVGAGDAHVHPGHDEAAVVEDRPDLVGVAVVRAAPDQQEGQHDGNDRTRSGSAFSWHLARVALADQVAVVEEGVGAGDRLGRAAGAAVEAADQLESAVGRRCGLRLDRGPVELRETGGGRPDPRVVAVAVVVGGGRAELGEGVEDVGA